MPQLIDPMLSRLDKAYLHALREFNASYEVEIVSCAYWKNRPPWEVSRRTCPDTFMLFPLKGEFVVTLEEEKRTIRPGSYLCLPEGTLHGLSMRSSLAKLEQVSLHVRIQDRWRRPLAARFSSSVVKLRDPAHWHRKLKDFASLMWTDADLARSWGPGLVRELCAERLMAEPELQSMPQEGDARVGRVMERMREELASPVLSIDALASSVGLTGTQLRKLFYRETGTRPKEHLQQLRMERAVHLLRHTTQTIELIASACGFATDNYFHLVFQKAFGMTPTAFREKEVV